MSKKKNLFLLQVLLFIYLIFSISFILERVGKDFSYSTCSSLWEILSEWEQKQIDFLFINILKRFLHLIHPPVYWLLPLTPRCRKSDLWSEYLSGKTAQALPPSWFSKLESESAGPCPHEFPAGSTRSLSPSLSLTAAPLFYKFLDIYLSINIFYR